MNFYGWIITAPMVMGVSIWWVCKAIKAGAGQSPTCMMLGGIYFVLLGHFGLALTSYYARASRTIEAEDEQKQSGK